MWYFQQSRNPGTFNQIFQTDHALNKQHHSRRKFNYLLPYKSFDRILCNPKLDDLSRLMSDYEKDVISLVERVATVQKSIAYTLFKWLWRNCDQVRPFFIFLFLRKSCNMFHIVFLSSINSLVDAGTGGLPILGLSEQKVQNFFIKFLCHFNTVSGFIYVTHSLPFSDNLHITA